MSDIFSKFSQIETLINESLYIISSSYKPVIAKFRRKTALMAFITQIDVEQILWWRYRYRPQAELHEQAIQPVLFSTTSSSWE